MKFEILIMILALPLVTACTTNNAFTLGDTVNICTGNCTYQNSSNYSQYIDCDDSVEGRLTAFYPNNTLIMGYKKMSRNGNVYNYTIGITSDLGNTTGTYNGRFLFFAEKGWISKDFTFTISEADTDGGEGGDGGGGISGATSSSEAEVDLRPEPTPKFSAEEVKTKIDRTIEDIQGMMSVVGSWISPQYPWLGWIVIISVGLIIYIVSVRHKEAILNKIEKQEKRKYKPAEL